MTEVRWGIVAPGVIANRFAEACKNSENSKLVAVASRSEETAKAFADKHGIEKFFSSYEALAKSDSVDAVYVSSPHAFHAEQCKLLLKNGKHVLCEKPVTINNREFLELCDLAKEKNLFLMEAMWTKFLPAVLKIKELIANGEIGEVLEVSADFCGRNDNRNTRLFINELGGGSLLDTGVYCIAFALNILGDDVVDVKSTSFVRDGVDERTSALLTFKNGAVAKISSAVTLSKPIDAYIYGRDGYIYVPNFYTAYEFDVVKYGPAKRYKVDFKGNGFENQIEEANRCILSGALETKIHTLKNASSVMAVMDEIRRQGNIRYKADEI